MGADIGLQGADGMHGCRGQIGDAVGASGGVQIGGHREHIREPVWLRGHTRKCKVCRDR